MVSFNSIFSFGENSSQNIPGLSISISGTVAIALLRAVVFAREWQRLHVVHSTFRLQVIDDQ